jgi:hypothetical protein
MSPRAAEVEGILKDLFVRFLTKIMLFDISNNQEQASRHINLLSCVLRQNEALFSHYEKDLNSFVQQFYAASFRTKRKFPEDMISYIFKEKILKSAQFKIAFSEDEIKFYSARKPKLAQSATLERNEEPPERRLGKIEAML